MTNQIIYTIEVEQTDGWKECSLMHKPFDDMTDGEMNKHIQRSEEKHRIKEIIIP